MVNLTWLIFMGNAQLQAKCSLGVHSRRCDSPQMRPRTDTTSSSLSTEAVWGEQALSPPSSYQFFVFHSIAKSFLQSHFFHPFHTKTSIYHREIKLKGNVTFPYQNPMTISLIFENSWYCTRSWQQNSI